MMKKSEKLLSILPGAWKSYVDILEENLAQTSYEELRNKLIIYEKTHLQRHGRD